MSRRPILPVVAGAVAGFLAGWWWGRATGREGGRVAASGSPSPRVDEGWADRWGDRMDAAVGAAAEGIRTVGNRWRPPVPLEVGALAGALERVEGAAGVRARILGEGLVELVGDASDPAAAAAAAALGAIPGVRAVVNRVWTPSSAHPGQIDDLPGFG